MAGPKPEWLLNLVKTVQRDQPATLDRSGLNQIKAQLEAARRAASIGNETGDASTVLSNHQIASALRTARSVSGVLDDTARLLRTGKDSTNASGALLYRNPGYLEEVPEMVLVESLGSNERGHGRALLQKLANDFPENPIGLETLPVENTIQFYLNRGFRPVENNPIGNGQFMVLDRGVDLKAKGGSVRPSLHANAQKIPLGALSLVGF
jgi:hypothetical protein